jgi:hypothetical protein
MINIAGIVMIVVKLCEWILTSKAYSKIKTKPCTKE